MACFSSQTTGSRSIKSCRDFPLEIGEELPCESSITLKLDIEEIAKFLESPCEEADEEGQGHREIKSLRLLETGSFQSQVSTVEEQTTWASFISFWEYNKLECLQVGVISLPIDPAFEQLLNIPSIRVFRCYAFIFPEALEEQLSSVGNPEIFVQEKYAEHGFNGDEQSISRCLCISRGVGFMDYDEDEYVDETDSTRRAEENVKFPSSFNWIEDIGIFRIDDSMDTTHKTCLFTLLADSNQLKKLAVCCDNNETLEGIKFLIDMKKEKEDFNLTVRHAFAFSPELDDEYMYFAKSVAASSSKICLRQVNEAKVAEFEARAKDSVGFAGNEDERNEITTKFLDKIEGIYAMEDGMERLGRYTNLKTIQTLRVTRRPSPDEVVLIDFPQKLEHIGFDGDIPPLPYLPESLTSLKLNGYTSSMEEFMKSLNLISNTLPNLKTLDIAWTSSNVKDQNGIENYEKVAKEMYATVGKGEKFKELKSLRFDGSYSVEDSEDASHKILIDGFQIPMLSLTSLTLSGHVRTKSPRAELNFSTINDILSGRVAQTLLELDMEGLTMNEDAEFLYKGLVDYVCRNRARKCEENEQ